MKTAVNFKFRWGMYLLFCGISAVLGHIPHLLVKLLEDKGDEAFEHALWTIPILFFCFAALGIWGVWPQLRDGGFFEISTDENGLEWRSFRWRKSVSWSEIARAQKREFLNRGYISEEVVLWDKNGEQRARWYYSPFIAESHKKQLVALENLIEERSGVTFETASLPFFGTGAANAQNITSEKWHFQQMAKPLGIGFAGFTGLGLLILVLLGKTMSIYVLSPFVLLGLTLIFFDSKQEVSETEISRKSPLRKTEIAWDEVRKVKIESGFTSLTFFANKKRLRFFWPPRADGEALLHFLESKREQFGFQVER